jgi:triacylglycerol lipase
MNPTALHRFDPALARGCVLASRDAYAPRDAGAVIRVRWSDTVVGLYRLDGAVLVAFRGTADLRNWLTDLDCFRTLPRWAEGGEVHLGFCNAIDQIWDDLIDSIHAGDRLIFTGHSLGGALAMLAAFRLRGQVEAVYTFGQPRVGNKAFALFYDAALRDRTFRVVHAADIVPRVPWLLGTYRHAGHEVYFAREREKFLMDPSLLEKLPDDLRIAGREVRRGHLALLADHHVDNYVKLFNRSEIRCVRKFP